MADLNKKYQQLIEILEKSIKDKNDLNLVKSELSDLIIYFTDMVNKSVEMENNLIKVDNNIRKLERRLETIEDDIYVDSETEKLEEFGTDQMHDNDYEFEITCPYCDFEFLTDASYNNEKSVECPKCHKTIELEWNNSETCYGDCHSCGSHCYDEDEEKSIAEDENDYKVDVKPADEDSHKKDKNDNEDDM